MYTDYANVVNKMIRADLLNSYNVRKTARKYKSGEVAKSGESAKPHKYWACRHFFKLKFFCVQQDKAKIRMETDVRKEKRKILWKWESNIL